MGLGNFGTEIENWPKIILEWGSLTKGVPLVKSRAVES